MSTLLITFCVSTGGLFLLVLLLRAEEKRGHRMVLARVRASLDYVIALLFMTLEKLLQRFGGGALRRMVHYVIHRFLRLLLAGVRGLEVLLRKLQRTNKSVAETIVAVDEESHLSEVRAHRESIRLTDEEKRQKRREMLE